VSPARQRQCALHREWRTADEPSEGRSITSQQTHILTVIGCGNTTWAREGRLLGSADLPLSNTGRASISEAAAQLASELGIEPGKKGPIALVRHPDDEAARDTARVVAEAIGAKAKVLEKLADPNLGLLEGLSENQFAERYGKRAKQWQHDLLSLNPPEGEPIQDMRARLFDSIAKLLRRSKTGETAIVLHDVAVGLLWCWSADRPTSHLWEAVRHRPMIERIAITPEALESLIETARQASAASA